MLTHPLILAFVVGFVALTVALVLIGLGIDAYEKRRGRELDLPNWAGNSLAIIVGAWLLGAAIILLVIFLGISGGGPYGSGAIYGD